MEYKKFLNTKKQAVKPIGREVDREQVNEILFDFQKDIVLWSVNMGRCAVSLIQD